MDNLDEMEIFLPIHKLLKLTQEDIDNLNRVIRSEEIELVIKTLPTKKSSDSVSFVNSTKLLRKNNLYKLFQKTEEECISLLGLC